MSIFNKAVNSIEEYHIVTDSLAAQNISRVQYLSSPMYGARIGRSSLQSDLLPLVMDLSVSEKLDVLVASTVYSINTYSAQAAFIKAKFGDSLIDQSYNSLVTTLVNTDVTGRANLNLVKEILQGECLKSGVPPVNRSYFKLLFFGTQSVVVDTLNSLLKGVSSDELDTLVKSLYEEPTLTEEDLIILKSVGFLRYYKPYELLITSLASKLFVQGESVE